MRKILVLLFLLYSLSCLASTTNVTGTVTGADGQVWANGTYTIEFRPAFNNPTPASKYTNGGVSFTQLYTGSLDATGSFTVNGVADNNTVAPALSQWTFTVCPLASFQCATTSITITGANQDVSTQLSAVAPGIIITALAIPKAYLNTEVNTPAGTGSMYYNSLDKGLYTFDGTNWNCSLTMLGAVCANQYPTLNAAITALGGSGTVYLSNKTYTVTSPVMVPTGVTITGVGRCGPNESYVGTCGAIIKGSGPSASPVVYVHDASHVAIQNLTIDCSALANCVALQYDSDNAPSASWFEASNLYLKGFHLGFVCGESSGTASTNNFQADIAWLHDIQAQGADTTAEAIRINSSNACDASTIERWNAQNIFNFIHEIRGPIGTLHVKDNNAGSLEPNATVFQFDSTNVVSPIMEGNETEGLTAGMTAVHDSSGNGSSYQVTWKDNQFNPGTAPVICDGNSGTETIVSIANLGGNAGVWSATNNCQIVSIGESDTQWTGNVTVAGKGNILNHQSQSGTFTGTGTDTVMYTYTLPAYKLKQSKGIRITIGWKHVTGTATVTYKVNFGGSVLTSWGDAGTGESRFTIDVYNNAGTTNAQNLFGGPPIDGTSIIGAAFGFNTAAVDTTVNQTITFTMNVAATDQVRGDYFLVEWLQ